MAKEKRLPKANYFLERMVEAYDNGNVEKGDYYKGRLAKMGIKPIPNKEGKII
jgi:hypothetical protein